MNESTILRQAELYKRPIPEFIANAPELLPGLALYYKAFFVLTTCRSMGGPIPWLAMRTYCQDYDIVGEQREYFYDMITHMDRVYQEHVSKKDGGGKTPISRKGK